MEREKLRIRLLSDLHLEFLNENLDINFKKDADVLILAGDIGSPYQKNYKNFIKKMALLHKKIFIIAGNHEYYGHHTIEETENKIKSLEDEDIIFLQKKSVVYCGVKFIGCTLWSCISDKSLCKYINDFHCIGEAFDYETYNNMHQSHKNFIETELKIPSDLLVVITHHLPSYALIDEKYHNNPLNSFYASNMEPFGATNIWCYGHTHTASQKKINNVNFFCNPKGYNNESSGWNPDFIFEI